MRNTNLRIELTAEECNVAMAYHGGQSSMLYAAASTGALALGTIRPSERCDCTEGCRACQGKRRIPLTDTQWFRSLAERLESEASEAAEIADGNAEDDSEYEADTLREIERMCRAWLDANPEER